MAERSTPSAPAAPSSTASGAGRILVTLYGILALGASARAAVQLSTRFDEAPIAYLLSGFSAVVYVIATFALGGSWRGARRVAWVAVGIELVGVLVIGAFSLLVPEDFPQATVWSEFGRGYLFVPLVLPVIGLWWLRRTGSTRSRD
ncbi:MAG: hypothetical protein IPJ14_14460 [Kineosporiaceae bacterium]|nr:hypothetical protein [Kineosporiaceae bacterium]